MDIGSMLGGLVLQVGSIGLSWAGLALLFVGLGSRALRILGRARPEATHVFGCFWIGTCFTLLFLQAWHLFLPVSTLALVLLSIIAGTSLSFEARRLAGRLPSPTPRSIALFVLLVGPLIVWIANNSAGALSAYDSGMYHLPALEWSKRHAIVPGIGNLHGRLAFNNASLLLGALLDRGAWAGRSEHLQNGLFLTVFAAQAIWAAGRSRIAEPALRRAAFGAVLLVPLVYFISDPRYVASYTPDVMAVLLLFIGAASALHVRAVASGPEGLGPRERFEAVIAILTLSTAVAVKLTAIVAALALCAILVWALSVAALRPSRRENRPYVIATVGAVLMLGTFLARGAVLSGYPLYPDSRVRLAADWRVPIEQAEAERAWVFHYGRYFHDRDAYKHPDSAALEGWSWVGPWFRGMVQEDEREAWWFCVLPAALIALGLPLSRGARRRWYGRHAGALLAGVLLLPVLFWFVTSPRPRFGIGPLWVLAAFVVCHGVAPRLARASPTRARLGLAGMLLFAGAPLVLEGMERAEARGENLLRAIAGEAVVPPGPDRGLHPRPEPQLGTYRTDSGLVLFVPEHDNRCLDGPLLCTPHPAPNLRLRKPSDPASGFRVDGAWRASRWPNEDSDFLATWRRVREAEDRAAVGSPEPAVGSK